MIIAGILDNQFFLSGVNAYWKSMADILSEGGHRIYTIGLDDGTCKWNRLFFEALPGTVYRLDPTGDSSTEKAMRFFRDCNPDIIIHHYSDAGINISLQMHSSLLFARWQDVYVCHSDDQDHYRRIENNRNVLSAVICVSDTCRDHVVARLKFDPSRVFVHNYLFSGVSSPVHTAGSSRVAASKKAVILYAGRLEKYQKRAGYLVELAQELDRLDISYELHIAGCGSLSEEVASKLRKGVEVEKIFLHGYLAEPELFKLMEYSNIYVSFSEFEGLSTSLVQAMHYGLVPVITNTRSGTDFIRNGKNGFLFDVYDIPNAVKNIELIANNPKLRAEMAKKVFETVTGRFDANASAKNISMIMNKLQQDYEQP